MEDVGIADQGNKDRDGSIKPFRNGNEL